MIEIEITQEAINYLNALADADPEVSFEQALTMLRPGTIPATPLFKTEENPLIEVETEETTYNHLLSAPQSSTERSRNCGPRPFGEKACRWTKCQRAYDSPTKRIGTRVGGSE